MYLHKLAQKMQNHRGITVAVAPSNIALQPLALQLSRQKVRKMELAVQNIYHKDYGAYTGEVAATQVRGLVKYAIVGHSERRHVFGETNEVMRAKVAACLRNKITPILCVGETADERTFGETADVVRDQILGGLGDVVAEDIQKVIIAYEPVWAISSTGNAKLAVPDEIAEVIKMIREVLKKTYEVEDMAVLYGGSVNPSNAGAYLTVPGVNGLLVGGASLISEQFLDIIEVAKRVKV